MMMMTGGDRSGAATSLAAAAAAEQEKQRGGAAQQRGGEGGGAAAARAASRRAYGPATGAATAQGWTDRPSRRRSRVSFAASGAVLAMMMIVGRRPFWRSRRKRCGCRVADAHAVKIVASRCVYSMQLVL